MHGLTVLVSHSELVTRSGAELYVLDVASGLARLGHTPLVYAPRLGALANRMREATIPVTDDIGTITIDPDVIVGQTNLELLVTMLRFPGVPAVRMCHGWQDERPWLLPGIERFLCVDETTRDRAVGEWGLPAEKTLVLLNFADMTRFALRDALPERPSRALVFGNLAVAHLDVVRRVCAARGIEVDAVGLSVGAASDAPEALLLHYDIVFAKARCAIEALATGAAVVLCDASGAGPMVTSANLDDLRRMNFGIRALAEPLSADWLAAQIDRYAPADAAAVARRMRGLASSDAAIDHFGALCEEVAGQGTRPSASDVARAAAPYVASLAPRLRWAQSPRAVFYAWARQGYFALQRVAVVGRVLPSRVGAQRVQRRLRP